MFLKQPISYLFFGALFGLVFAPVVPVFALQSYVATTYTATSICHGGGTLNGYINPFFSVDTTRWFEWGTSHDSLTNTTNVTRNGSNTEYFQQDIFNLTPNTIYYFRAVAQNSKGVARGEVRSFMVSGALCPTVDPTVPVSGGTGGGTPYTGGLTISQSVVTKPVTDITDTSAKLNAVALPIGSVQTFGWFEWGATPNLGRTTARRSLGTSPSIPWSESISGLTPGTTYFLKPVIENQNGLFDGALFSFRTTGVSTVVPDLVHTNTTIVVEKKSTVLKIEPKPTVVSAPKEQKTIEISVVPDSDTVAPGERVKETIQFENTTGATMKEVVVHAVIPCDAVYVASGSDTFLQTGTMLTRKVGDVKPKETVKLVLWLETPADAPDKTSLETIAVVNWEDKINPNYTQSVGMASVVVDKDKAIKENAAAAGAARSVFSFFPNNLKDGGAVIGVLFILFALYMIFLVMHKKDTRDEDEPEEEFVGIGNKKTEPHPALYATNVPQKNTGSDPFITDKHAHTHEGIVVPIVPMKKNVTEKGAPPDNLPI